MEMQPLITSRSSAASCQTMTNLEKKAQFIEEHDVTRYGIVLWPVEVSCLSWSLPNLLPNPAYILWGQSETQKVLIAV